MKDRKAKQSGKKAPLTVIERSDEQALRGHFAEHAQVLLPLLKLVEDAHASVEELMNAAACSLVEQLLTLSAEPMAGRNIPGAPAARLVGTARSASTSCSTACRKSWRGKSRQACILLIS